MMQMMRAWQVSETGNFEHFTMIALSRPVLSAGEVQITGFMRSALISPITCG